MTLRGRALTVTFRRLLVALVAALALVAVAALALPRGQPPPAPSGSFDHGTTRFPLVGGHAKVACESCHPPAGSSRQWEGVPRDCRGCHGDRKNHAGALGTACVSCHDESGWKAVKHDAASHRFPLTGKHQLACASCHAGGAHLTASATCADCHAQPHGGTKAACETCHAKDDWHATSYLHPGGLDRLPGKHKTATCLGCHQGFRFEKASFECASCHTKDVGHDDLGDCARCHAVSGSWRQPLLFQHDAPARQFPLTDGHAGVACDQCHQPKRVFGAASRACESCHTATPHADLGPCAKCHTPAGFSKPGFSHDTTRFALDARHGKVACADCHERVAPGTFEPGPQACATCHADPHGGQFPAASAPSRPCTDCHGTSAWRPSTIDATQHAAFRFPLRGEHEKVTCSRCHQRGSAPAVQRFVGTPSDCVSCHADRHQGLLGTACASCHGERSWKDHPTFDHAGRTGFAVEGAHARAACDKCHAGGDKLTTTVKRPITCASCHTPKHGEAYGKNCTGCHTVTRFEDGRGFDHATTLFPLERRHRAIACASCHKPDVARPPQANCRSCHGDPHLGRTALDCDNCHRADSWLLVRYDHDLAEFPLKGKHFFTPCRDCHTNDVWSGLRRECVSCHRGDRQRADMRRPKHASTSWNCIDCHRPWSWHARP